MVSSPSPNPDALRFFTLEASDCLERLDAALGQAGPAGPAHDEFVTAARTLRGSATMHRVQGMAELAQAVERAARALRDGMVRWSPAFAAAMVAAVDDLKLLLHAVRNWGPPESERVAKRVTELAQYIPRLADRTPATATPAAGAARTASGSAYIARAVRDIANTLSAVATRAHDDLVVEEALAQVRAVRGIAALSEVPAANEILEAVERVARTPDASARASVFRAAGDALRRTEPEGPELIIFRSTYRQVLSRITNAGQIVPVGELGFGNPETDVVHAATAPPTTRADRFRLEVVSQAEHLLLLVGEARDATHRNGHSLAPALVEELTQALQTVRSVAVSFEETDVSDLLATFTDGPMPFDFLTLNAIDDLARILADPHAPDQPDLAMQLATLTRARFVDTSIGLAFATPVPEVEPAREEGAPEAPTPQAAAPAAPPATPRPVARPSMPRAPIAERIRTPTGPALQALLADSLTGLSRLADDDDSLFALPPALAGRAGDAGEPRDIVPIESLLYRGPAALAQARTLRAMVVPGTPPSMEVVNEILDLIDLAASAS